MITAENERYQCVIPELQVSKDAVSVVKYLPVTLVLLKLDISSLENSVNLDQLVSDETFTVFHESSEVYVLIELTQLNWLENRSQCAIINYYSTGQRLSF